MVKSVVFPFKNRGLSVKKVDQYLNDMMEVGLLYRYDVSGVPYLCTPTWDFHQTMRKEREPPSNIPPPDDEEMKKWAQKVGLIGDKNDDDLSPQYNISEYNIKEGKIIKRGRQNSSSLLCINCGYEKKYCECDKEASDE